MPGAGLATCLYLPNVGASPFPFSQRFLELPGSKGTQCFPDRAYNLPRRLEAFWNEAKTSYVQVGGESKYRCFADGIGCTFEGSPIHTPSSRLLLGFSAPNRRRTQRLDQSVDLSVIRSATAQAPDSTSSPLPSSSSFIAVEDVVQYNVEQELQCPYRYMLSLRPPDSKGTIQGKMRVAGFLPIDEPQAKEANGRAVAVYDYSVSFTPPSTEDAEWENLPRRVSL